MYALPEIKTAIAETLAEIEQFIPSSTSATLHAKPTEKWSIAEELVHLTKSDQGCALAFNQSFVALPKTAHSPRNYTELVAEYKEKQASIAAKVPARLIPGEDTLGLTVTQAANNFSTAAAALLQSLDNWQEAQLDAVTVWKHPVLGPVTAREMMLFTIFHNRHHLASVQTKKQALPG